MKRVLDLIFPPRCVGCRGRGEWICIDCRKSLPILSASRCRRCATPLAGVTICPRCWRDPPAFSSVHSAFRFEGTIRQAIHHLKYRGARHLAAPLVDIFLDELGGVPSGDVLVPVPLHPSRQRSRGYNQAGLLADRLAARLVLPVDNTSMTRVRDTPAQVAVPPADRLANVRGAFVVAGRSLADKRVLLVDDVATTASTLRAVAAALTESGARSVDALVIARAGTDDPRLGSRRAGF